MYLELTPRGLLTLFFRQYGKFLLVFLLISAAGLFYVVTAKPRYEATGSLLVKFGREAMPNVQPGNDSQPGESQNDHRETIESNIQILQSHDLLQTVVDEIGPEMLYPGITAKVAGVDSPREVAIRQLEGDLSVRGASQSNVIDITLLNGNPQVAAGFVQRLLDVFIARQSDVYNKPQTDFLAAEVKQAADRLQASQQRLQAFKTEVGVSSLDEELTQLLAQKSDASNIAFQSVDDSQSNVAVLQAKEAELANTYRPDSPQVQQAHRNVQQAMRQLGARQSDARSHAGGDGNLSSQLGAIDRRIATLEAERNQYNDLQRQVQIDEEAYKSFITHAEDAKVNAKLNEEKITRISVVDEPVVPMQPSRPRRKLIMALSLLAALLLATGTALSAELLDERFASPQQLGRMLQVPVMASFLTRRKV